MQYQTPTILLVALAITPILSTPLPLNINLGAYSPALVVGDGAIGFKDTQSVEQLISTLESTASNSAAANGAASPAIPQASASPASIAAEATPAALPEGMGKLIQVDPREEAGVEVSGREIGELGDGNGERDGGEEGDVVVDV